MSRVIHSPKLLGSYSFDAQIVVSAHCLHEEGTAGEVSRRFAMVRLQQPAETLDADDLTLTTLMLWRDDLVKALVNSLVVIVLKVLARHRAVVLPTIRLEDQDTPLLRIARIAPRGDSNSDFLGVVSRLPYRRF